MKYQSLFSMKNLNNAINLLPTDFAQNVVVVKENDCCMQFSPTRSI